MSKRRRYIWAASGILVLLAGLCTAAAFWLSVQLNSLDAARRWRGESEMRFAQVACFFPVDDTRSVEDVVQFRRALEQKLSEESLAAPQNGSLFQDAYSGEGTLTIAADHGTASVHCIGVGGDFFLFHPMELRSGSLLSERDLMQDRVVLDENLAWTLFGSSDVAGMTVTIGQTPFVVSGVVHREDDCFSQAAYPEEESLLFLSYDAFHALTEQGINCYEIVLPDVVSGYGLGLVKEELDVGRGDIVENSRRYSVESLLAVAGDFGRRSMRQNGVIYPYWENAVRMTEDWLSLLLVLSGVFLLFPAAAILAEVIRAAVKIGTYVKRKLPESASAMVERRRERQYGKNS